MAKMVKIFIEDGILAIFTQNVEEADLIISSGIKEKNREELKYDNISKYLMDNGISLKGNGFKYLVIAISLIIYNIENNINYSLCNDVYPVIAKTCLISPKSVEKAMWFAVHNSKGKDIGVKQFIEKYFLSI